VCGTVFPSMAKCTSVALKGRLLGEVTQTELFGWLRSEKTQVIFSFSSDTADNVKLACMPASRWKPIKVKLVPPDSGPRTG